MPSEKVSGLTLTRESEFLVRMIAKRLVKHIKKATDRIQILLQVAAIAGAGTRTGIAGECGVRRDHSRQRGTSRSLDEQPAREMTSASRMGVTFVLAQTMLGTDEKWILHGSDRVFLESIHHVNPISILQLE
jgi:hypothetical protein